MILGCLCLLGCQCGAIAAPDYYHIEHFCSHCGLRLTLVPCYEDPLVQINRDMLLMVAPPTVDKTDTQMQQTPPKNTKAKLVAPSPLGPPVPISQSTIGRFWDHHSGTHPTFTLQIQHAVDVIFPSVVWSEDWTRRLYDISRPGMPTKYRDFFPVPYQTRELGADTKNKPDIKPATYWDPTRSQPHIRVRNSHGIELSTAQVFDTAADFVIHTPKEASSGEPHSYNSYRSGLGAKPTGKPAFMLWTSSAGPMLWLVRRIRTATTGGIDGAFCLVLMDAYDRLVAVVKEGTGATTGADASAQKEGKVAVMEFYDERKLGETLVGEILASYSALRWVQWDRWRMNIPTGGVGREPKAVWIGGMQAGLDRMD